MLGTRAPVCNACRKPGTVSPVRATLMPMSQPSTPPRRRRRWIPIAVVVVLLGVSLAPLLPRPPLDSGAYVQAVSDTSAVIRFTTREPRNLGVRVERADSPISMGPTEETREHRFVVEGLTPATAHTYDASDDVRVGSARRPGRARQGA